jgi:hypothetical protein
MKILLKTLVSDPDKDLDPDSLRSVDPDSDARPHRRSRLVYIVVDSD